MIGGLVSSGGLSRAMTNGTMILGGVSHPFERFFRYLEKERILRDAIES